MDLAKHFHVTFTRGSCCLLVGKEQFIISINVEKLVLIDSHNSRCKDIQKLSYSTFSRLVMNEEGLNAKIYIYLYSVLNKVSHV